MGRINLFCVYTPRRRLMLPRSASSELLWRLYRSECLQTPSESDPCSSRTPPCISPKSNKKLLKTKSKMYKTERLTEWVWLRNLAVQHGVLPVVDLLGRVHGDVVVGLGFLVLLLVFQLRTKTLSQQGGSDPLMPIAWNQRTNETSGPTTAQRVLVWSVWLYVALELAGMQGVLQLQEVWQIRGAVGSLVLVELILHLKKKKGQVYMKVLKALSVENI